MSFSQSLKARNSLISFLRPPSESLTRGIKGFTQRPQRAQFTHFVFKAAKREFDARDKGFHAKAAKLAIHSFRF